MKPHILFCDDLVEPLETNIKEIKAIGLQSKLIKHNFLLNGAFVYAYSLFENALTECLRRFLLAFPERLPSEELDLKVYKDLLLEETLSYNVMDAIIEKHIQNVSYGKFEDFLKRLNKALNINDMSSFFAANLSEKKERRNILLHNNLVINRTYVKNTGGDSYDIGKKLAITADYLMDTVNALLTILEDILSQLKVKYEHYTQVKAVNDIWKYLFDSPLLVFEQHWIVEGNTIAGYRVDEVAKYASSLSTGEKTFLAYLLQNFNRSIVDQLFDFGSLGMQASIDDSKLAFLVEIFNRYPLLLQGKPYKRRVINSP